jgi:hypothetical protein
MHLCVYVSIYTVSHKHKTQANFHAPTSTHTHSHTYTHTHIHTLSLSHEFMVYSLMVHMCAGSQEKQHKVCIALLSSIQQWCRRVLITAGPKQHCMYVYVYVHVYMLYVYEHVCMSMCVSVDECSSLQGTNKLFFARPNSTYVCGCCSAYICSGVDECSSQQGTN